MGGNSPKKLVPEKKEVESAVIFLKGEKPFVLPGITKHPPGKGHLVAAAELVVPVGEVAVVPLGARPVLVGGAQPRLVVWRIPVVPPRLPDAAGPKGAKEKVVCRLSRFRGGVSVSSNTLPLPSDSPCKRVPTSPPSFPVPSQLYYLHFWGPAASGRPGTNGDLRTHR